MTTQASVPFLDLHSAYIELKAEIDSAISDVLSVDELSQTIIWLTKSGISFKT